MPTLSRGSAQARRARADREERAALGQKPAAEPPALRPGSRTRWLVATGLVALLVGFTARCLMVARTDSITSDESTYLVHGLSFWLTGDDLKMWELGTPRLPHLVNSWPAFEALGRAGLLPERPDGSGGWKPALARLVLSGCHRALVPARCAAIGWGLALILATFWGVARTQGAWLGLAAAAILSFVPEVLAHSAIAGSDMPFAAAAVFALVMMARYAERPTTARWLGLALAIGLAWAMRHSALLLLPMAAGLNLWFALRNPTGAQAVSLWERLAGSFLASLLLGTVAFVVLWAGDGFGTVSLADAADSVTSLSLPRQVGSVDVSGLPIPSSALSVLKQVSHQSRGHDAYFCGEVRSQGWLLYFPVAFLLKTPVGFLILMVLAAARFRPRNAWEVIGLVFLALLWISLIRSKVNIGVRYALLTYPLLLPFVVRNFSTEALRDRVWTPLAVLALGWLVTASLACHPRYLSYFNEIGGGSRQGWLYLADSNIDWGQDFDALARTLRSLGINDVTLDISSERRLREPGLYAIPNPSRDLQPPAEAVPRRRLYDSDGDAIPVFTRYIAVSVSRLFGLYSHNDMSWLLTRRLVARVGDSVFLFDMDQPAAEPLGP